MRVSTARVACLLPLAPLASAYGAEFWAYQYKHLDVTAVGDAAGAVKIARNLERLDAALTRILSLKATNRLPTHIYVLPEAQIRQLMGDSTSEYSTSGFDATVITEIDAQGRGSDPYWGVYFGYVGSLLAGDGALRYPYWFRIGVPQVFATTEFEYDHLKTGGISPGSAYTLMTRSWIPMRTFLALQQGDPQLQGGPYLDMYGAESWYLTREVLVESRYREQFGRYLELLHEGKSESEAFAASLPISYEELDKVLRADLRAPTHVYRLESPHDASSVPGSPVRLTEGEVQARLAVVDLATRHRAEALRLAGEALKAEPANEHALRVLARAQLQEQNYAAALAAVDQLAAHSPTPDGLGESGDVLRELASAQAGHRAALTVDAGTLMQRAKAAYEGALASNPEDLRSWAGLAELYASRRDLDGARAFLPSAMQALERHPRNVTLAYALTEMCAQTNQPESALKFAGIWRENALTDHDRDRATAAQSRLEAYLERRSALAPAGPGAEGVH
jgi:tetratricopeptide (TPR) repeat protein